MENLILNKLKSSGALFRVQAIIECLKKGYLKPEEADEIIALQNDDVVVLGRRVGEYATAILNIIQGNNGAEKSNEEIEFENLLKAEFLSN